MSERGKLLNLVVFTSMREGCKFVYFLIKVLNQTLFTSDQTKEKSTLVLFISD